MLGRVIFYFCLIAVFSKGWADFENISASRAKQMIINSKQPSVKTALSLMALGLDRLSIRVMEDLFQVSSVEEKANILRLQSLAYYRSGNYEKCLDSLEQLKFFGSLRLQEKILKAYCLMRGKKYKDCVEYLEAEDDNFFSSQEIFSVWLTCLRKNPLKDRLKKRLPSLSPKYRLLALISLAQEAHLTKNKQELAELAEQMRSLLLHHDQISEFDQFLLKLSTGIADIQLPDFYEKAFEIIRLSERYAR